MKNVGKNADVKEECAHCVASLDFVVEIKITRPGMGIARFKL